MSLGHFLARFKTTTDIGNAPLNVGSTAVDPDFAEVINGLGGKTFDSGLYRVFRGDQVQSAKKAMEGAFPEFAGRIVPFGYDWLGRHFAIDFLRTEDGKPQVLLLEVGAGEAMQIPANVLDFHNTELVEFTQDALSLEFFLKWQSQARKELLPNQCVGYKVPLFLGGEDEISNLEVIDLSVYVEICGQLRNKVRKLKAGETIRQISIT